jgi:ribosomal protein S18 acetylase RimI-like enzyme
MEKQAAFSGNDADPQIKTRRVSKSDMDSIIALDEQVTGLAKSEYWHDIFSRYANRRTNERFFLVAEAKDSNAQSPVLGYIVGEVRAWEFGSEPSGWVFAFSVDPGIREQGVGEQLFGAISDAFRDAGVTSMRTMVQRKNQLHMAFFRSEGMAAGPYIQLEKNLDE